MAMKKLYLFIFQEGQSQCYICKKYFHLLLHFLHKSDVIRSSLQYQNLAADWRELMRLTAAQYVAIHCPHLQTIGLAVCS